MVRLGPGVMFLCAAGCMASPPAGPLVKGPTLSIDIGTVSQADLTGTELVKAVPLGEAARGAHAEFLAANAGVLHPERFVALQGARVRLRPGAGVDHLADAFGGLMVFVAPGEEPTARVYLANAIAPASVGPVQLGLIARRGDYEAAQAILRGQGFLVGVSGPSPLAAGRVVEFGLVIELDLAIIELQSRKGGH